MHSNPDTNTLFAHKEAMNESLHPTPPQPPHELTTPMTSPLSGEEQAPSTLMAPSSGKKVDGEGASQEAKPPLSPSPPAQKRAEEEFAHKEQSFSSDEEYDVIRDLEDQFSQAAPLDEQIIEILSTVYDPEIPVNIYELGLIYDIDIYENNHVVVQMTLTTPACPVAGSLPGEVETKILKIPGVNSVRVDLVWDPPWTPDLMSEAARLQLGMFW